jgi:hypothetical protein
MLFESERLHFFRPLTGKYREQVVACLRVLYARLYSSLADYSRVIGRDLVLEVFQEAITRTAVLDDVEDDKLLPVRDEREQANWMLKLLIEHGWIELHVDEISLTGTYSFSRVGRLFTQPMAELAGGRFRTRHRNTRNTCSALRSFLAKREIYDLLDAYEYSERIVADFSDVIAELEDRKRQLVREVGAQQLVHRASDEFFEFMEKRFMPDLALRFSEDSVVKYREELDELLGRARAQRREACGSTGIAFCSAVEYHRLERGDWHQILYRRECSSLGLIERNAWVHCCKDEQVRPKTATCKRGSFGGIVRSEIIFEQ